MTKLKSPLALWSLFLGGVVLMVAFMWPQPANAQCGSSASSCKNCHEIQAEYPVNNDGTSWHQAHAFGDFCEFCHAGNVQATDETTAHTGMEAPLDNIEASCGNCHAADLNERAGVYATALGVEIGSGGPGDTDHDADDSGGYNAVVSNSAPASSSNSSITAATTLMVDDPNTIDYVARYNEMVLGIHPTNWGNIILIGLILVLLVGGGAYVIHHEGLLDFKFGETRSLDNEYPADIVDMLPAIAGLHPHTRRELKHILDHPEKSSKAFDLIETLMTHED
ncbi:MAG: hypothetical protein KC441_06755 [Anaerolineales bacterium]|nr:hypothetical protein [Anaerolineales bacterium]